MHNQTIENLLRIDTRGQASGPLTRALGDQLEQRLRHYSPRLQVTRRQLAADLPLVDDAWIAANLTDPAQRSEQQRDLLAVSDGLIAELQQADAVIMTVPMHNFSVPGVVKAWIDQVCRAGLTFRYTENGPQGLLADRPVYLVLASGGVAFGSQVDYLSGYLKQIFGFIGISDVHLVTAEAINLHAADSVERAQQAIDLLLPESAGEVA